ncbi:anti-sigma factor antagonist [Clostridia bacterium OttesenSCG-928-F22]|nr:anti-sigma factor antagonist [Clostridia bacterium OttesenSCG-928-F22]
MVLKFDKKGNCLTVAMQGELDHHCVANVKSQLDRQLEDVKIRELVFDFKNVSLMDSSGIGVIIGRYKIMDARQGKVAVKNPSRAIDKIMSMSGIYKIIQKIG